MKHIAPKLLGCFLGLSLALGQSTAAFAAPPSKGTMGFVIRDWFTSVYNSKFNDECPDGLTPSYDEIWWRGISREERAKITQNGLNPPLNRLPYAMRRGPKGENVCLQPDVVKDPPMRVIEGKYSYGANIDGTTDGRATAKTCKHEKFTHPDGTPGIDNQMYRLVGCIYGWRKGGLPEANAHEGRGTSGLGMILVEITGVNDKDPRNSDNVTITFHRSIDQFALDGNGKPLPYSSYNIDTENGKNRYGDKLKGSIKNGVLTTDRGDVRVPYYGGYGFMHPAIKNMALHMEIAEDGATATGQVTGYYNADEFLYWVGGMVGHATTAADCPALHVAARQLADGYPDPKTGECTHLSTAIDIKAYSAFIIHPEQKSASR